jgi:8-oxo-dGTP pyrophosphatase MutT (NUDIX family)|tara:strand:- start:1170 stop:1685 length:516 start_codon:yes stop_codon:yes gene_type:complete
MTDSEKSIILQRIENIQSSQDDALGKRVKQYIENKVDLKQLIKNSVTSWTECEWGFPKGRRNAREKDFDCAIREFEEETGYKQTNIQLIENVVPYEEVFVGSNYKTYKHKYYIARANYVLTEDETLFQKSEVSKLQWKSYDECLLCIRPYNIEKKKMLFNVNKCITHFKLK